MRFSEDDILICQECGATTLRTGPVQKYCRSCSAKKDVERKRQWARNNPRDYKHDQEKYERRKEFVNKAGAEASESNRVDLTWVADNHPEQDLQRVVRVSVPFDHRFSKNALWNISSRGHVFMREEIKTVRDHLISELKKGTILSNQEWYEGKVWIDIFVMKPNARSDAINVIDLVCDAIKKAIEIDDRWFCIRRLDWSIVKEDPRILIGVSQVVTEHHRVCSYCGHIKPLTAFMKNKSMPLGVGRECKECTKAARKQRKVGSI